MSQEQDLIRLAEAMQLPQAHVSTTGTVMYRTGACWTVFGPLTDANDDYAVLEWMRKSEQNFASVDFAFDSVGYVSRKKYKVGDYARAGLTVLDND